MTSQFLLFWLDNPFIHWVTVCSVIARNHRGIYHFSSNWKILMLNSNIFLQIGNQVKVWGEKGNCLMPLTKFTFANVNIVVKAQFQFLQKAELNEWYKRMKGIWNIYHNKRNKTLKIKQQIHCLSPPITQLCLVK